MTDKQKAEKLREIAGSLDGMIKESLMEDILYEAEVLEREPVPSPMDLPCIVRYRKEFAWHDKYRQKGEQWEQAGPCFVLNEGHAIEVKISDKNQQGKVYTSPGRYQIIKLPE